MEKGEAGANRGDSRDRSENRSPLVGDVLTYGAAYEWDGSD